MDNIQDVQGPNLPKIRIGAIQKKPRQLVAKVMIEVISGGAVQFSVAGEAPQANTIAEMLKNVTTAPPSVELPMNQILSAARRLIELQLTTADYDVEELPLADVQLNIQFDFSRGLTLGEYKPLHTHTDANSSLSKDLFGSVSGIFLKASNDLASEILRLAVADDHIGAAQAVKVGREGIAFLAPPPRPLLEALQRIEIEHLDTQLRWLVCETRVAVAYGLREYELAEQDALVLLSDNAFNDEAKRASFENIRAISSKERGEDEAALSMWRKLANHPERLRPGERAWVWRNISLALPHSDSDARRAARLSVDAFLEAGDKIEAATSLMHLSRMLEHENPDTALKQLDAMMEIIDRNGLVGSELQAAIHHARGNRLLALRAWAHARAEAEQAIALRRGVLGGEEQLISSLHLASIAASNNGETELAEHFDAEAKKQEGAISSTYYALARRVTALFKDFDRVVGEALLADVRASDNVDLISGTVVAMAMRDPSLSATDRLRTLEAFLREIDDHHKAREQAKHPVQLAIATVLRDDRQFSRAASWLRRILENNPLDIASRDMLLDCLWKAEDWGTAAAFLKGELDKHGEKPGLLYAYGRSLVEAGDISTAVSVLTKALKLAGENEELRMTIFDLRERALNSGGTIEASSAREVVKPTPVLRQELEQALEDYAKFVAADKRMVFWIPPRDRDDYEWVTRPEKRAQDLLHTFLKARFHSKISVFEELSTGAGRLDILLKFEGGLTAVVELKMCGFGYSSTYAASGEDQIHHYMENRSCHLGYLVVHDSRLDNFGSRLIESSNNSANTISEVFVDVRP
ncbi:hypothetical protein PQR71_16160, partial [Paraburkholderia fungorum]|uniref:tetratricopeptide repeat protein n=1 Tax=Paraburkholderia fungorum TaxID=134537 RepID=UPI0038BCB5AC